jgi:glucose/arabinose dehydrogenase
VSIARRAIAGIPLVLLVAATGASCTSCNGSSTDPPPLGLDDLVLRAVASGFSAPLYLTAPTGDPRLFVVEKGGRIKVVKNGVVLATPFLDISSKVSNGSEQGLLSVAFHPSYATNGLFYVYYTDTNGDVTIERYHVSTNADVADAASASLVLAVQHRLAPNHNGGLVLFGEDGKLYTGIGDGGGGGDPQGNGQNRSTLLGKLLRIDVDAAQPYAIPPDNPFAGAAGLRGEIWAYGLRNPWRFAFDRSAGMLYIADVGQNAREEINAVAASAKQVNYGWNIMEGRSCYNATTCAMTGLTLPILDYGHANGECSVIGGFVYRGSAMPALRGSYFYSDLCAGFLRSLRYSGSTVSDEGEWEVGNVGQVLSFGEDANGELYVLSGNGNAYKLELRAP